MLEEQLPLSDILTKIEAYKREEIAAAKRAHPLAESKPVPRQHLRRAVSVNAIRNKHAQGEYALIAEI